MHYECNVAARASSNASENEIKIKKEIYHKIENNISVVVSVASAVCVQGSSWNKIPTVKESCKITRCAHGAASKVRGYKTNYVATSFVAPVRSAH